MRWTLLLALLPTVTQSPTTSPTPQPEDLGTITGHITCADTQRRFAQTSLIGTKFPPIKRRAYALQSWGKLSLPELRTRPCAH